MSDDLSVPIQQGMSSSMCSDVTVVLRAYNLSSLLPCVLGLRFVLYV